MKPIYHGIYKIFHGFLDLKFAFLLKRKFINLTATYWHAAYLIQSRLLSRINLANEAYEIESVDLVFELLHRVAVNNFSCAKRNSDRDLRKNFFGTGSKPLYLVHTCLLSSSMELWFTQLNLWRILNTLMSCPRRVSFSSKKRL